MNEFTNWQIRVEKKLTQIHERVNSLNERIPLCEKASHKRQINILISLVGFILTSVLSLFVLTFLK